MYNLPETGGGGGRGNSGNARKKTFFFQEVFPKARSHQTYSARACTEVNRPKTVKSVGRPQYLNRPISHDGHYVFGSVVGLVKSSLKVWTWTVQSFGLKSSLNAVA